MVVAWRLFLSRYMSHVTRLWGDHWSWLYWTSCIR